jgi:tetratricopeptide (TPR) repeat protein
MRRLLLLLALALAPQPAAAEIRSVEACTAAVAANPAAAREDAALWARTGGGVAARLCEADALAALGANGSAALLLTRIAENPNRAMPADLRAVVYGDAAGQWLAAGRPDLAAAAIDRADRISVPDAGRLVLRARVAAAEGDWPQAREALTRAVSGNPQDPLAHALLAATLRHLGDAEAAGDQADLALQLAPDLPEALFEAAAAAAETGDADRAAQLWRRLIALDPDGGLADEARAGLQRLASR